MLIGYMRVLKTDGNQTLDLRVHKAASITEAIAAREAQLICLPPYRPT